MGLFFPPLWWMLRIKNCSTLIAAFSAVTWTLSIFPKHSILSLSQLHWTIAVRYRALFRGVIAHGIHRLCWVQIRIIPGYPRIMNNSNLFMDQPEKSDRDCSRMNPTEKLGYHHVWTSHQINILPQRKQINLVLANKPVQLLVWSTLSLLVLYLLSVPIMLTDHKTKTCKTTLHAKLPEQVLLNQNWTKNMILQSPRCIPSLVGRVQSI